MGKKLLTDEQIDTAAAAFALGTPAKELAGSLGVKLGTLYQMFWRRGIKSGAGRGISYVADPHCFGNPESETVAYFIGLLMADGCISEDRSNSPIISLGLKSGDRVIVDRLNDFLGGRYKVTVRDQRARAGDDASPQAYIQFHCRQIVSDLASYGVVPRKSLKEEFKRGLETNRHAWRGVIDGDGYLTWNRQKGRDYPVLGLCGSLPLLTQFVAFVRTFFPKYKGGLYTYPAKPGLHYAILSGRMSKRIAQELYEGATIALPRKAAIAAEFMRWELLSGRATA